MLDLTHTFPLVTQITTLRETDTQIFSVPLRSEDGGDRVMGFLYLDYSLEGQRLLTSTSEPPSTFSNTQRKLTVNWTVQNNLKGCHQITLLATHFGNVDFEGANITPVTLADVAIVSWWVNFNPDEADPLNLGECPAPGTAQ